VVVAVVVVVIVIVVNEIVLYVVLKVAFVMFLLKSGWNQFENMI
jgi:hypothetical protein